MVIPSGSAVVAEFQNVIHRWHDLDLELDWEAAERMFPVDLAPWIGQVRHLGLINCFQWHLEDECRSRYDDLARLGLLKRSIDESNQRRVRRIDEIDRRVCEALPVQHSGDEDAPACLVTPGTLLDRLSILQLKWYHALAEGGATVPLGAHQLLTEQIDDLSRGIERLMDDLVVGRQRLKFYRTQKLYGAHG